MAKALASATCRCALQEAKRLDREDAQTIISNSNPNSRKATITSAEIKHNLPKCEFRFMFCGCCVIRYTKIAMIFLILFCILSSIAILFLPSPTDGLEKTENNEDHHSHLTTTDLVYKGIWIGGNVVIIILAILVFLGIKKRKIGLMVPYLIYQIIIYFSILVFAVLLIMFFGTVEAYIGVKGDQNPQGLLMVLLIIIVILGTAVVLLLYSYFFVVPVYRSYNYLKKRIAHERSKIYPLHHLHNKA